MNGYEVKSNKNGNSIFLPAAGLRNGSELRDAGSWGYYWSSSHSNAATAFARFLFFNSGERDWNSRSRFFGFTVRPVCP